MVDNTPYGFVYRSFCCSFYNYLFLAFLRKAKTILLFNEMQLITEFEYSVRYDVIFKLLVEMCKENFEMASCKEVVESILKSLNSKEALIDKDENKWSQAMLCAHEILVLRLYEAFKKRNDKIDDRTYWDVPI